MQDLDEDIHSTGGGPTKARFWLVIVGSADQEKENASTILDELDWMPSFLSSALTSLTGGQAYGF